MTWQTTNTAKGDNKLYSDAKGVVPSLDLRFASQKNLNDYMTGTPLVDHQRSMSGSNLSAGTFVNSSGLIETAKVNLVSYSQEFENSYYTKANITTMQATTDVAAPDGTFTARYISGASNGRFTISSSNFTSQSGRRKSIYLRAVSGSPVVNALTQAAADPNPVTLSSTEWLRFEIDTPSSEVGGTTFVLDFRGSSTTTEVYAWGLQIEEGSAATTYIPTTNLPSAAPRFDHNPTTGESLGLLIEESRTNLALRSEEFDNPTWLRNNSTITANTVTAPDGTQTADTIEMLAAGGNDGVYQPISVASGTYTYSFWARADSNKTIKARIYSAVFEVSFNLTSTWQRFSVTESLTGSTAYPLIKGLTVGDQFYIWGAQLEAGSFPTSYIPTTGTTLTRSADVASITGTNFSSWYNQSEGTIFGDYGWTVTAKNLLTTAVGTGTNGNNGLLRDLGTTVTIPRIKQAVGLTNFSVGNVATPDNQISYVNGSVGGLAANIFSPTYPPDLQIGRQQGSSVSYLNGTISRLTYFPERLPDATLQAITAP